MQGAVCIAGHMPLGHRHKTQSAKRTYQEACYRDLYWLVVVTSDVPFRFVSSQWFLPACLIATFKLDRHPALDPRRPSRDHCSFRAFKLFFLQSPLLPMGAHFLPFVIARREFRTNGTKNDREKARMDRELDVLQAFHHLMLTSRLKSLSDG